MFAPKESFNGSLTWRRLAPRCGPCRARSVSSIEYQDFYKMYLLIVWCINILVVAYLCQESIIWFDGHIMEVKLYDYESGMDEAAK